MDAEGAEPDGLCPGLRIISWSGVLDEPFEPELRALGAGDLNFSAGEVSLMPNLLVANRLAAGERTDSLSVDLVEPNRGDLWAFSIAFIASFLF